VARPMIRDEYHQPAGEDLFQQVFGAQFDVHLARRGVVRVQGVKTGRFGGVADAQPVQENPEDKNAAGMRKPPRGITGLASSANTRSWTNPCNQPSGGVGFALAIFRDGLAPIEGKINPKRTQCAENGAENAALPHVEPVGFYLDDGDGAVALEVLSDRIDRGEGYHEVHMQTSQHQPAT